MVDLFGHTDPGAYIPGDLFAGAPYSYAGALADLRETATQAEKAARLRPEDEALQRRAAAARRDYLQARDYAQRISAEELSAESAARCTEGARCGGCGLRSCPGDCATVPLPF